MFEQKKEFFNDNIDKYVKWHNEEKPHMSLWFEIGETPKEAFFRKMYEEQLVGLFFDTL